MARGQTKEQRSDFSCSQIDKEFLDRQIEEKEERRQLERVKECRMDEALVRSSKLAMMLERRGEEVRLSP